LLQLDIFTKYRGIDESSIRELVPMYHCEDPIMPSMYLTGIISMEDDVAQGCNFFVSLVQNVSLQNSEENNLSFPKPLL
jgi:hypothetical protein